MSNDNPPVGDDGGGDGGDDHDYDDEPVTPTATTPLPIGAFLRSSEQSHPDRTEEEVVVRGALDTLGAHDYQLTPDETAILRELLKPYVDYEYVNDIQLAVGFLDADETDLEEAASYLFTHLRSAGLLTVQEAFQYETTGRDAYNELCRDLGEEVDSDAPFEMPEIQGRRDNEGDRPPS